jgi:hypothetical protein
VPLHKEVDTRDLEELLRALGESPPATLASKKKAKQKSREESVAAREATTVVDKEKESLQKGDSSPAPDLGVKWLGPCSFRLTMELDEKDGEAGITIEPEVKEEEEDEGVSLEMHLEWLVHAAKAQEVEEVEAEDEEDWFSDASADISDASLCPRATAGSSSCQAPPQAQHLQQEQEFSKVPLALEDEAESSAAEEVPKSTQRRRSLSEGARPRMRAFSPAPAASPRGVESEVSVDISQFWPDTPEHSPAPSLRRVSRCGLMSPQWEAKPAAQPVAPPVSFGLPQEQKEVTPHVWVPVPLPLLVPVQRVLSHGSTVGAHSSVDVQAR